MVGGLRVRQNNQQRGSEVFQNGISNLFNTASNAIDDPKEQFDYFYKIIIIGDERVGKTNFLFRIADNRYEVAPKITYGVEYVVKTTNLPNSNQKVRT